VSVKTKIKVCSCDRKAVEVYDSIPQPKFCTKCGKEFTFEEPRILGVHVRTEETSDPSCARWITIKKLKELLNEEE